MSEKKIDFKPFLLTLMLLVFSCALQASPNEVEQAVVRIINYQQTPNWHAPWMMNTTTTGTGSGFLIQNQWILTNAHVVSDSKLLLVNKISTPEPFVADVVAIAHDSDLALLKVRNSEFYEGMQALKFGKIPDLLSHVRTYGFPVGGQKISRTEGVVSRIEFGTYVHPGIDSHLLVQTDSAINPGNSGGPVIQEGLVVGLAFQSNPELNDVGYFIPVPLIQRFFEDIIDGQYDGVPEIGIQTSSLLSPSQQQFLNLPKGTKGVLIDAVLPHSAAEGYLQSEDVIIEIEGQPVDFAGLVDYEGHQVSFFIAVEHKQIGDLVKMKIWRQQQFHELSFPLKAPPFAEELRNRYDQLPRYLIFGGMVFMPLSRDYLNSIGNSAPELLYELWYRESEQPNTKREQVVVLTRVLPAPVNSGYTSLNNFVVERVNGVSIRSLTHLKEVLEQPQNEEFYIFESQWDPLPVILERKAAMDQHQILLKQYGIVKGERL
ncbi:trypsin-like peptidase domain-containing protein [Deltaproteobacteria bacterium TL4]